VKTTIKARPGVSPGRQSRAALAALIAAGVAFGGAVVGTPAALGATASDVIDVDFSTSTGAFRGGASGMLYGLSDDGVPTDAIIAGARPTNITQKAPHGAQHPNGDPLEVEDAFFSNGGQYILTNIQDYYADWSYNGGKRPTDFDTYLDIVETVVTSIRDESEHPEKYVFVPFNEPDGGNWYADWSAMKNTFLADWKAVYQKIKEIYPEAKIAGMGDSSWHRDRTRDIMTFARDNDVLPDMFTWHELGISNLATFRSHFAEYRQIEQDLGIAPRPINITEYAMRRDMSVPGQLVQWLAMFEDAKVDAETAYWTMAGNLNDNMAKNNEANGAWWLLKWYGDITGDTVKLTPPSLNVADTVQGIAALDAEKKQATVVFGGGSQDVSLNLGGLDAAVFGDTVDIQVRQARWSGQEGEALTPPIVLAQRVALDGTVSVTVPNTDRFSAYQLVVTPSLASQPVTDSTWRASIEAEDTVLAEVQTYAKPLSDAWTFATSGQRDVGSTNKIGSSLTWTVTVPTTGTYRFGAIAGVNGPSVGPGQHALFVDGQEAGRVDYEAGFSWGYRGLGEVEIPLTAGEHQLSLRMSADGSTLLPGSDISLDRFDLTLLDGPESVMYPANLARLSGAVPRYDSDGVAGSVPLSGADSADFHVAPHDTGYYDLQLDYAASRASGIGLAINGRAVSGLSATAAGAGVSTARVHLAAGVSRITVTATESVDLRSLTLTRAAEGDAAAVTIEMEDAEKVSLTGAAKVENVSAPTNVSGRQVGWIGGGAANTAVVHRPDQIAAGQYDFVARYANADKNTGHAYNTDVISRFLDVTEAGGSTTRGAYRHNYSWKGFWSHTIPLDLTTAAGDLTLGNASGNAPNLDWIQLAPLVLEVTNESIDPPVDTEITVAGRCVAGKAQFVVTAKNTSVMAADITLNTPYGEKTLADVPASGSKSSSFATRTTGYPAGEIDVIASAVVDGRAVSTDVAVPYQEFACR
jgi:hypothetical protein